MYTHCVQPEYFFCSGQMCVQSSFKLLLLYLDFLFFCICVKITDVTDLFLSHVPLICVKYGNSGGPLVNLVSSVVKTHAILKDRSVKLSEVLIVAVSKKSPMTQFSGLQILLTPLIRKLSS